MGKNQNIYILLYYKFTDIENPEKLAQEHLDFCKKLNLRGKVLLGHEGINGSVSGTKSQTEAYKSKLKSMNEFSDIVFKEEKGISHPFKKMIVKTKNEIIRLDQEVDIEKRGQYISPEEFLEIYKDKDKMENTIILDARNDYESKIGKFKSAITPEIKTFREFPKVAEQLKGNEDKNIVMYCTGGIRCEKASAYLKEKGFNKVKQLKDGIIHFCQEHPNTVWEGSCFVFDKRLTSNINQKEKAITNCEVCKSPCDLYRNCKNSKCDKLTILCQECEKKTHGCCSFSCFKIFNNKSKKEESSPSIISSV